MGEARDQHLPEVDRHSRHGFGIDEGELEGQSTAMGKAKVVIEA